MKSVQAAPKPTTMSLVTSLPRFDANIPFPRITLSEFLKAVVELRPLKQWGKQSDCVRWNVITVKINEVDSLLERAKHTWSLAKHTWSVISAGQRSLRLWIGNSDVDIFESKKRHTRNAHLSSLHTVNIDEIFTHRCGIKTWWWLWRWCVCVYSSSRKTTGQMFMTFYLCILQYDIPAFKKKCLWLNLIRLFAKLRPQCGDLILKATWLTLWSKILWHSPDLVLHFSSEA